MAQLKAKRSNLGVWNNDFDYKGAHGKVLTPPRFPSSLSPAGSFVPRLNYWVTSFGKIHRRLFVYERGRGNPSNLMAAIAEFATVVTKR